MYALALTLLREDARTRRRGVAIQNLFAAVFHWTQIEVLLDLLVSHRALLLLFGRTSTATGKLLLFHQMVSAAGDRGVGYGVKAAALVLLIICHRVHVGHGGLLVHVCLGRVCWKLLGLRIRASSVRIDLVRLITVPCLADAAIVMRTPSVMLAFRLLSTPGRLAGEVVLVLARLIDLDQRASLCVLVVSIVALVVGREVGVVEVLQEFLRCVREGDIAIVQFRQIAMSIVIIDRAVGTFVVSYFRAVTLRWLPDRDSSSVIATRAAVHLRGQMVVRWALRKWL